jgi:hypothetical protein
MDILEVQSSNLIAVNAALQLIKLTYYLFQIVARDSQEIATLPNGKIKKNHAWCAGK